MANMKKANEEAKEAIAKAREDAKTHNAEWNKLTRSMVDKARLKKNSRERIGEENHLRGLLIFSASMLNSTSYN